MVWKLWFLGLVVLMTISQGTGNGTLYGYSYDEATQTSSLYEVDPTTGSATHVCDIGHTPFILTGSSQAVDADRGLLLYTTQLPAPSPPSSSHISTRGEKSCRSPSTTGRGYVATLNPKTCAETVVAVAKENQQANLIKYDNKKNTFYMAFQNPQCLHSSLEIIDLDNGDLVKDIGNVIIEATGNVRLALDVENQYMYYIQEGYVGFFVTTIQLTDSTFTNLGIDFSHIGGGVQWMQNAFTMQYVSGQLIGMAALSNASGPCYPAGVFSVTIPSSPTGKAVLNCVHRLENTRGYMNMLTDSDPSSGYYFQVMDNSTLITYDVPHSRVAYTVKCPMCSTFSAISFLPSS